MATVAPAAMPAVQMQVYRDFINNPPGGGAIRVYGNRQAQDVLAVYTNLGHVRQYTPDNDSVNGLYALEISLQAIFAKLQLPLPTLLGLRNVLKSDAYEQAAQNIASQTNDAIHHAHIYWDLTGRANLSRDALRLVLAVLATQIKVRLRLGVLTWNNDVEGRVWSATVLHELLGPPAEAPEMPFTVWVVDDARYGNANPNRAECHWSGLAPEPLYMPPMALPLPPATVQLPVAGSVESNSHQADEGRTSPAITNQPRRSRESPVQSTSSPSDDVNDLAKARTEYPAHLTEEEVLNHYPEKMSMEFLLYVLRRYKQNELLTELQRRNVTISSDVLRQRKKAALENRAKNRFGVDATKSQYQQVSREYNNEVLEAKWYAPRAERSENKRKRGENPDEEVEDEQPRRKIRSTPAQHTRSHRNTTNFPATADMIDSGHHTSAARPRLRPFYRSNSLSSNTTDDERLPSTVSVLHHDLEPPQPSHTNNGLEDPQPATETGSADFTHSVAATSTRYDAPDGYRPAFEEVTNTPTIPAIPTMTDEEFAALLKPGIEASDATAAEGPTIEELHPPNADSVPQMQSILSGKALQNYFMRSHPHTNGQPDANAGNGRGAGPPGRPLWFRWPKHRQVPELTLEQIDWYFKDGREQQLLTEEKQQLHEMKKQLLDNIWYDNQRKTKRQQSLAAAATSEVIEIPDDESSQQNDDVPHDAGEGMGSRFQPEQHLSPAVDGAPLLEHCEAEDERPYAADAVKEASTIPDNESSHQGDGQGDAALDGTAGESESQQHASQPLGGVQSLEQEGEASDDLANSAPLLDQQETFDDLFAAAGYS